MKANALSMALQLTLSARHGLHDRLAGTQTGHFLMALAVPDPTAYSKCTIRPNEKDSNMNQPTTISNGRALPRRIKSKFAGGLLPALLLLFSFQSIHAGSATWNLNPTSGDWNTATNWTPATVPNGIGDIATFALSHIPDLSLSADATVAGIVFNPGASVFTVTADVADLSIGDAGVTNNSGVTQNFVAASAIFLFGSANAGTDTVYTINGSASLSGVATAGDATFISNGATMPSTGGALLNFLQTSTGGYLEDQHPEAPGRPSGGKRSHDRERSAVQIQPDPKPGHHSGQSLCRDPQHRGDSDRRDLR
jgi:hypothetical protein